jgi:hypothetical protein
MWNNVHLPIRQRASRKDYLAARDDWLKCVLGDRNLSGRAKIAAGAIYFFFNYEGFAKDGGLWAWPSLRTLDKATGQSKNTVIAAIEELETAGYLKAHHRYDPKERRYKSHLYQGLVPGRGGSKSGKKTDPKSNQGGSDGCTRVVQTGGTDSLNDFLNDSLSDFDFLNERSAANAAKGEFDEGSPPSTRSPAYSPEAAIREVPDKPYAQPDIDTVRIAIEECHLTYIPAVVIYARGKGRWMSEKIIQAMCRDGLFVRDGDNICAPPTS